MSVDVEVRRARAYLLAKPPAHALVELVPAPGPVGAATRRGLDRPGPDQVAAALAFRDRRAA